MIRSVIIGAEREFRRRLQAMLAFHPQVTAVGEATTAGSARALLRRASYNLVFLDTELRGGSGFDVMPDVQESARVVVVTSDVAHAFRAFEVNAIDFLLKPVAASQVARALARFRSAASPRPAAVSHRSKVHDSQLVHLQSGRDGRLVPVEDIAAIRSHENYSVVHLVDGRDYLVRRSLKKWESQLADLQFVRVHRTAIINLSRLIGYRRSAQKTVVLQVQGVATPFPASRTCWPRVRLRLARV